MPLVDDAEHFSLFAKSVERAISKYGHLPDEDLTVLQKSQVEELAKLEDDFRAALIRDSNGNAAYNEFVCYVLEERKNILVARPYFRERRSFFVSDISVAIRNRDIEKLKEFHLNYHWINLVSKKLIFGSEVRAIVKKIENARYKLVEMNIPLVINRARIFWSRTPKSHLSFMDLVQIGSEGLIAAIDKYCGEYSEVWRDVAIGRMVGNLISRYSETMIHFYPADKRKIYSANKFRARHIYGDYEIEDLVKDISKVDSNKTNPEEITGLMAAAAMVSADSSTANDNSEVNITDSIAKYEAPEELRPDLQIEMKEADSIMQRAISSLSLFDRKLLRLKGLNVLLE
jgi:DNA-directed RNA polymerase specialized sigma subunit